MRTLEKNKVVLWVVRKNIGVEEVDADGFLTGNMITTYSIPAKIKLPLYPANGSVAEEIFGKDVSFDMMSVSNDIVLHKNDYLFNTEPLGDFDKTYDFTVDSISKSLNTYAYGLKARVK